MNSLASRPAASAAPPDPSPLQPRGLSLRWVAAGLMLVIAASSWLYWKQESARDRRAAHELLSTVADLKVNQLARWRKERLADAVAIRATPYAARRALDTLAQPQSATTRRMFTGWLDGLLAGGIYKCVLLVDADFNVSLIHPAGANGPLAPAEKAAAEEAFRTRNIIWADLHRNTADGPVHLSLCIPLVVQGAAGNENVPAAGLPPAADQRTAGVLVLRVDAAEFLFPLIQAWPSPSPTAETLLVRQEGEDVLYLNELRHRKGPAMTLRRPLGEERLPAAMGLRGERGIQEGVDYRGVRVVATARPVPDTPWVMVAKVDEAELYAPLRRDALRIGVIALLLAVAVTLGVTALWRQRNEHLLRARLTAEKERRALAERYQHLMKNAQDAIILADEHNRILEANDRAIGLYGYSPAELRTMTLAALRPPACLADYSRHMTELTISGWVTYEGLHQRKDGTTFPVEVSGRIVEIAGSSCRLGIIRDITERKQAEAAIKDSERRYYTLAECSPAGIFRTDSRGQTMYVNRRWCELAGLSADEALGDGWLRAVHPEDREALLRRWHGAAKEGEPSRADYRFLRSDGSVAWVLGQATPERDAGGRHTGYVGTVTDITERKHTEEVLRESEERLNAVLEGSQLGFWDWNIATGEVRRNERWAEMIGYTLKETEVTVRQWTDLVHPEDRERAWKSIQDHIEGRTRGHQCEYRMRAKSGEYRWILDQARIVARDEQGRPLRMSGTHTDMTQRKQAEQRLIEANLALEESQTIARLGSYVFDVTTGRWTSSRTLDEVFGIQDRAFTRDVAGWVDLIHPDEREAMRRYLLENVVAGKERFDREYRIRRLNDGAERWVHGLGRLDLDEQGRVLRMVGTIQDITERKQAEEAVASAKAFLDRIVDMSPFAMWISDKDGTAIRTNRSLREAIHLPDTAILGKYNVHKDQNLEAQGVAPQVRAVFAKHEPARFSIPWKAVQAGDVEFDRGRDLHIDVSMFPILNAQNELTNVVCQWIDITERKLAEEALRASERHWQTTFDAIADGVALLSADDHVVKCNAAMERLVGGSGTEIVGRRCYEVVHGTPGPIPGCPVVLARQTKHRANMELPIGGRHFEVTVDPMLDALGQYQGAVHVISDITERKRLEQERAAIEVQLRQQQKLESIGTLAGGVAHEINNPINGIMNYAQLIHDRLPPGSPLTEFAGEILHETHRVANIVRNLLTFARDEKQSHSPAHMGDIVEGVMSLIRTVIRHDHIDLTVDVPVDLPELKCRTQQLQQVIMNLMTNARDALNERYPESHPDKVLSLSARLTERAGRRWIRVTVEDHGTGITPEVRVRMFDPFFTTKPRDKGTGLGLAISHGIVKDHHGQLTVETEPGKFTRMHVDLPVDNGWNL